MNAPRLSTEDEARFPHLEIKKCVARAGYSFVWTATNQEALCVLKVSRKKNPKKRGGEKNENDLLHNELRFERAVNREIAAYKSISAASDQSYFVQLHATVMLQNSPMPALLLECFTSSTPLSKVIERKKHVKHTKILFKTLVNAVQVIHSCNIVHHDLKPENILLKHRANADGDGSDNDIVLRQNTRGEEEVDLRVIDFGMAQPLSLTNCCSPCGGTPAYAAPEVLWATKHHSANVDQWSLGAILFELLTGTPIIYGNSLNEYRYASLHVDFKVGGVEASFIEDENALELLNALMQQTPTDRISLEKVQECKYCTKPT